MNEKRSNTYAAFMDAYKNLTDQDILDLADFLAFDDPSEMYENDINEALENYDSHYSDDGKPTTIDFYGGITLRHVTLKLEFEDHPDGDGLYRLKKWSAGK